MSLASGNLTNAAISNGAASNVTTRTIRNVSANNNTNNTEGEEEGTGALAGIGKTNNAPNFGFQNRVSAAQQRAGIAQAFTPGAGGLTGAQIGQASAAQAQALSAAIGQAGAGAAEGLSALGKMFDKGRGGGGGSQAQASASGGGCKNGQCGNNAQAAWNAKGAAERTVTAAEKPAAAEERPVAVVAPSSSTVPNSTETSSPVSLAGKTTEASTNPAQSSPAQDSIINPTETPSLGTVASAETGTVPDSDSTLPQEPPLKIGLESTPPDLLASNDESQTPPLDFEYESSAAQDLEMS